MSNGQAELYDKDEAERRFEAALRGARISGHKPKMDIPKKHLESQVARTQDPQHPIHRQQLPPATAR